MRDYWDSLSSSEKILVFLTLSAVVLFYAAFLFFLGRLVIRMVGVF